MNIPTDDPSIEKSTISLVFRVFSDVSPDAGFDSKSVQKTPVLLHGYVTSFVRGVWPLESTVAQTKRKQTEPDSLKKQSANSILLFSAEEKQRPFFQRVQPICQTNKCGQTVDSSPEIRSGTGQDHTPDSTGFFKHAESPRGS